MVNKQSWQADSKKFDPGFFIKHFVKDMGIALEESKRMGLSLLGLALHSSFTLLLLALNGKHLVPKGFTRYTSG